MKKRQKTLLRRLFGMIFLTSLSFCLWLGQFPATLLQAQSVPPSQQVQQGVELYQSGDYQGALAQWETALKAYQQSDNRSSAAIVKENLARVYQQIGQFDKAIAYWQPAIAYYRQQGDSQKVGRLLSEQAQAYINLGQSRQAIALLCGSAVIESDCQQGTSLQIAHQQKDQLAEVAALGSLGEAYRLRGDYERAIAYLQPAQQIAPSLYQFSLLNSLGNTYAAIAQRKALMATSARQRGIEATARKFGRETEENTQKAGQFFQLSLENAIEQDNSTGQMRSLLNSIGLYSRLNDSPLRQSGDINQTIKQALTLLNRLPNSPEKVNAAIDLASLSATSEIITAPLAQCPVQRYLSDIQAKDLFNQALNIARKMPNLRAESFALGALGHYYECQQQYSEALHFTQEALKTTAGSLKYAIATTPSLRVITPQKSDVRGDHALILGVTKEAKIDEQSFKSLAGIPLEIQEVQTQFPNHKSLVDEQFNRKNLEQELDNSTYQIVHIATHAQFGFVPEDTFLVTGDNNKIAINQLESALRKIDDGANSVELLTLTACQTAAGDERAALGLAGIAVQTGVKSALASLWSVADESTLILVKEFYQNLVKSGVSKAEALQSAQVKLIKAKHNPEIDDKYDNPAYWSAF